MSSDQNGGNTYPYRIIGEHYQRPVRNRHAIIMVYTKDGTHRDGVPSLLEQLPNFDQLFTKFDQAFIHQAAVRDKNRLAAMKTKLEPLRPKHAGKPTLRLIVNKNFRGRAI